jgi:hypothetical protein
MPPSADASGTILFSVEPTARMHDCGGFTIALKLLTPNMPVQARLKRVAGQCTVCVCVCVCGVWCVVCGVCVCVCECECVCASVRVCMCVRESRVEYVGGTSN